MNRQKSIQIALIGLAIFCLVSLNIQQVNAQLTPFYLNKNIMPNALEATQNINDVRFLISILNRDVNFRYFCILNESTTLNILGDGWAFAYPISKAVDILDWYGGNSINLNGIKFTAVFNPYILVYNDTDGDGVLTTEISASANTTEAIYALFPTSYETVVFTQNLTPQQAFHFSDSKPNKYSWSFSFANVTCSVRNATLIAGIGKIDGTGITSMDNFTWINKSYTYLYDSSNKRFQLNYSITFGEFDNTTTHLNRSLANVHYLVSGIIGSSTTPIIQDNATNAFNTTNSINTPYLDFASGTNGRWDMVETKAAYTCNGTDYNATSCSTPISEFNVSINATQQQYFEGKLAFNATGSIGRAYICYDEWNGSVLVTDPYQFLNAPTTIYPLWYSFLPDILLQNYAAVNKWLFYSILLGIWGFGCFEINRRRGTEEGTVKIGETAVNIGSLLVFFVMILSTIILLSITEGPGLFIEIRKWLGYQL